MIKDLLNGIVNDLCKEPYFSAFKYRKRDSSFVRKTIEGFDAIELQFWDGYDLKRDCRSLVIKPLYMKRFNVLHRWFEAYSFKSLSDQRDNYSIGFDGGMIDGTLQFYFRLDGLDFDRDFCFFRDEVIIESKEVFENFNSLNKLYDFQIKPILEEEKELPNVGADWVFLYLKLSSIVCPEKYDELKSRILIQVEIMNNRGEPNIIEYYNDLKQILTNIETSI
ncbi:hypothetical protein [uncultured Sphingobacterium sp.]|jgi:hypothetical protein|uniref:hypothetical protein n=1 Tax=uncultured Sphingobacterium sp. TaxID=182688 RepID=UPI00374A2384